MPRGRHDVIRKTRHLSDTVDLFDVRQSCMAAVTTCCYIVSCYIYLLLRCFQVYFIGGWGGGEGGGGAMESVEQGQSCCEQKYD